MSKLPTDIIKYQNGLYVYNTKVFTEEDFNLAQNLGYIKTNEVEVRDLITKKKYKSSYYRIDVTECVIWYTLINHYTERRAETHIDCIRSLFGYEVSEGVYVLPNTMAISKLTKQQFKAIGLGEVSEVLKYNCNLTREFLIKGKIDKPRSINNYVKELRTLAEVERDLIRLYCFGDMNVFRIF